MYSLMNSKSSWNERLHVSDEVREELEFWEACIGLNGQSLWEAPSAVRVVFNGCECNRLCRLHSRTWVPHCTWAVEGRGKG